MTLFIIGQVIVFTSCSREVLEPDSHGFDFSHVNLAIRYFEAPSDRMLEEISATDAAIHLQRHSDRTGYYPPGTTSHEITNDLLSEAPSSHNLAAVKSLVRFAEENPGQQRHCIDEAATYLPDGAQPKNPLHITWGYDIGVAMDDHASLNFNHPNFLRFPEEIWFYCIHEVHHSGVMQIHPMPRISEIDTVNELLDFIRYATFLEGVAVHAARDARRKASALDQDPDYAALEDADRLGQLLSAYWEHLSFINSEIETPLSDAHWEILEEMSSGDRLWYVAGAAMAAEIESNLGRAGLLEVIRQGYKAFFDVYQENER